ncbi:MAG: TadE/TadG family type IV pilus assembly protein [Phycisphaerales bacterium]
MRNDIQIEDAISMKWAEKGNALVEFGLVLPILLVVLLGIMDWAHVHFIRMTLTNAAREGARVGVVQTSLQDAELRAVQRAQEYLQNSGVPNADVQAQMHRDVEFGLTVRVAIRPHQPLIGFVPTPNALEVSSVMRWELAQ